MNINPVISETNRLSRDARGRMLKAWGNPLFLCDWQRAVFIHYEVDPEALQREVPFELDLHEGRADGLLRIPATWLKPFSAA